MAKFKGTVVFDGAAAEPKGFEVEIEGVPEMPTANGTYSLKVANGVVTWVAENQEG